MEDLLASTSAPMTRHLTKSIILLSAGIFIAKSAHGQVSTNSYEVYVPPYMSLYQYFPDRSSDHPGTSANVQLPSSLWVARTANPEGVTVTLTTSQPFQNLTDPGVQRNAYLRMPGFFGFGGWSIDTPMDQTDYAIGKYDATVKASSTNAGFAWLPLEVTFLTGDVNTLAGGTYELTVVGTISGN